MVVEDESIVAKDIQNRLKRLGYRVNDIVSSGEEAIRKADETQPDLVPMDIVLKGEIDGIEAAKRINTLLMSQYYILLLMLMIAQFNELK